MLPGGASSDEPCGDDCALHRPRLHQTPERSSGAPPSTAPIDPPPLRHCWVTAESGRVPALHKGWRRYGDGWLAWVLHPVFVDGEWELREEWVPGAWVEPA